MNLADSIKSVLRKKSRPILNDIWKIDLKLIASEFGQDLMAMSKAGPSAYKSLKQNGLKITVKEVLDSGFDTFTIIKVVPARVKKGFLYFREDIIRELDVQTDQKQKTIFSLKLLGKLTGFTIGTIYNLKKSKVDFNLKGLRRKNTITQFIVAEIVFKLSQIFVYRFLSELEKEISDQEDLRKVRYFKELVSTRAIAHDQLDEGPMIAEDPAIKIVENLKTYIMTGKRERIES